VSVTLPYFERPTTTLVSMSIIVWRPYKMGDIKEIEKVQKEPPTKLIINF